MFFLINATKEKQIIKISFNYSKKGIETTLTRMSIGIHNMFFFLRYKSDR